MADKKVQKAQGNENITQIYDKVFKRILTLSNVAVINFINGIFGKNFPKDSKLTYNWTEKYQRVTNVNVVHMQFTPIDNSLEKTIADGDSRKTG